MEIVQASHGIQQAQGEREARDSAESPLHAFGLTEDGRMVTPSVLVVQQGGYGIANNVIGNRNVTPIGVRPLRPQTVSGAEAIVSVAGLDDALTLDVGAYVQHIDDRIVFNQLATDFVAINEAPVTSIGTLASVRLRADWFRAYASFTGQAQVVEGGLSGRPPPQFPVTTVVTPCVR